VDREFILRRVSCVCSCASGCKDLELGGPVEGIEGHGSQLDIFLDVEDSELQFLNDFSREKSIALS